MTSTSEASAMNGASACGWMRTSVEANDRDARAQRKLALAAKRFRILGGEPASKDVHRRSGLRHGDALAQTRLHEQAARRSWARRAARRSARSQGAR